MSIRPRGAKAIRALATEYLTAVSSHLVSMMGTWAWLMPTGSPDKAIDLPLIDCLSNGVNYEDTSSVNELTMGMVIAGYVPATNTRRPRTRVPRADLDEWTSRIPDTNRAVADRAMSCQGSEDSNACWNSPSRGRKEVGFPTQHP